MNIININDMLAEANTPEEKAKLVKIIQAKLEALKKFKEEETIIGKQMSEGMNKVLPRLENVVKNLEEIRDE